MENINNFNNNNDNNVFDDDSIFDSDSSSDSDSSPIQILMPPPHLFYNYKIPRRLSTFAPLVVTQLESQSQCVFDKLEEVQGSIQREKIFFAVGDDPLPIKEEKRIVSDDLPSATEYLPIAEVPYDDLDIATEHAPLVSLKDDEVAMVDLSETINTYNAFNREYITAYNLIMDKFDDVFLKINRLTPKYLNLPDIGRAELVHLTFSEYRPSTMVFQKSDRVVTLLKLLYDDMQHKLKIINEIAKINFNFRNPDQIVNELNNRYKFT